MELLDMLNRLSDAIPLPVYLQAIVGSLIAATIYSYVTRQRAYAGIPLILPESLKWIPAIGWMRDAHGMTQRGFEETDDNMFQVMTGTGPKIILPNRYADECRNHPNFNFQKFFAAELFIDYPGFEAHAAGLKDGALIQEVVRVKLTQSLGLVTADLVDETIAALQDFFPTDSLSSWQSVPLKQHNLDIIARLSSRVFLGKDLARNPRWLEITKNYTVDSFTAAFELRAMPAPLRPLVHWIWPRCRRLRAQVRDATTLISSEVQSRLDRAEALRAAGKKVNKTSDSIGWMYEVAESHGRTVDIPMYVHGQLSLSLAAIHTTTEGLSQAVLDLAAHPEWADPLREELRSVLDSDGGVWAKTTLYKLRLMDSFIKETQRVNNMSWHAMHRYVERPTTLSDGTFLPANSRIMISALNTYDSSDIYDSPTRFNPRRFLDLRAQPGQENAHQFVSLSPQHLAFGYGKHACPGRFFAGNELKVALAHVLMGWDVRTTSETGKRSFEFEGSKLVSPGVKVEMRFREKGWEEARNWAERTTAAAAAAAATTEA